MILNVLVKTDSYTGMSLEEIHNLLTGDELPQDYPGEFESFSPWNEHNSSISGAKNPDKMVEAVVSIRESALKEISSNERKIFDALSSLHTYHYAELVDTDKHRQANSNALNLFAQTLCKMTDRFTYGQNFLFINGTEGMSTWITEETLNNIKGYPDKYALIQCIYQ